ncbi:putative glyoxalase/Bleomycin resistance protein/Dihydroxybiphenyl dioxygenase [Helianthus anomalus]
MQLATCPPTPPQYQSFFFTFSSNTNSNTNRIHKKLKFWIEMASNLNPAYAYTVVYVKDVAKSVEFYGKAFGASVRRLDDSHR